MRTALPVATLMALALFTLGSDAYAGSCGSRSVDAGCGGSKASVQSSSCDGMKAPCVGAAGCQDAKSSAAADDSFLGAYAELMSGMNAGCRQSTEKAAQAWKAEAQQWIGSADSRESRERLDRLVELLSDWPDNAEAQMARFQDLSDWTIEYVKAHPERCKGAEIKTCTESGRRWVEMPGLSGARSS